MLTGGVDAPIALAFCRFNYDGANKLGGTIEPHCLRARSRVGIGQELL